MKNLDITNNDFERISWHDNMIHGFSFDVNAEEFRSDLIIDIDYIVEWSCDDESEFKISPSFLTFHDITDLYINIDWGESGFMNAASGIFIIDIQRKSVETKLRMKNYYKWTIILNDKNHSISFGASGFTQKAYIDPVSTDIQYLKKNQRIV
ncbi:hypothetical protein H0A36_28555 [Endozoicomonas sp. SM1973]|uniref:Uncharacterized protein n=1 Tax=Spartinivicinus marinus TaxID=2994442 RepID=A0A853IAK6_9GAMM|nr:hypothetical protein [Spartinivicinus marinus]MCX4027829.1 hypothetical protein [Spartinivicinus marinus]NYZ69969.1 hypothetical protein [Spartinivicinus marinus]